ncbi:MAG: hypothetical protein AB7U61_09625 [Methylocystis sp.]
MTGSRMFFGISAIGAALAGALAISAPAYADSINCNSRGCRAFVSHRTINRAAAAARVAADVVDVDDAATAAAWAHHYYNYLDD